MLKKIPIWQYIVMAAYLLLGGILVAKHEPWFDEAQAWLLARDLNPVELFTKYLRYEGSTGLWHLILMIPAKLGMPYISMNILSLLIASAGVFIFIRYSPFPVYIKIIFPFTYFIFFQYSVVARSYAMLPLLLFLTAMVYKNKKEKLYLFFLLLCIMSNVNLHGMIIAASVAGVALIGVIREWTGFDKRLKVKHIKAYVVFSLVILLQIPVLWPPADLSAGKDVYPGFERFEYMSELIIGDSMVNNVMYQSAEYPQIYTSIADKIAVLAVAATLIWLAVKNTLLLYAVPVTGLLVLFSYKYVNVWHQGIIFLLWIFALWVGMEREYKGKTGRKTELWLKNIVLAFLVIVMFVQTYWSASSFFYDYSNNYSASRELADYIKTNDLEGATINALSFHSISILPYFDHNIIANHNEGRKESYWVWSTQNTMPKYISEVDEITKGDPDIIIIGVKIDSMEDCDVSIPGYVKTRVFDGNIFWKDNVFEKDAFILYSKVYMQKG